MSSSQSDNPLACVYLTIVGVNGIGEYLLAFTMLYFMLFTLLDQLVAEIQESNKASGTIILRVFGVLENA